MKRKRNKEIKIEKNERKMRDKTQHIENQPLRHNQLVINKLCNVDKMWITFTIKIRNIE